MKYLSAGHVENNGNKILLEDQWNQTQIILLKESETLKVLNGYRLLIGHSFSKISSNNLFSSEYESRCEEPWFFRTSQSATNTVANQHPGSINDTSVHNHLAPPGNYIGTSECGNELLVLSPDKSFIYKMTNGIFFPFTFLQGTWSQVGDSIILKDKLVQNSYYLTYMYDTIYAGFNIPGSSNHKGTMKYYQSFILQE